MAEVAVVMPVRSPAPWLGEAVASVLGQSHRGLELVLVDDGLSEADAAMLPRDSRLRRIEPAGRGLVEALNAGWRASEAPWIARMDADDRSDPCRIERQLAVAGREPQLGVIASAVRLVEARGHGMARYVEWANGLGDHDAILRARFVESPVIHPGAMLRREWLERVGGYRDRGWAEDHDLWLRLLAAGCRFGRAAEAWLDWRDSERRLTRCDPRYGEAARRELRAAHLARLPEVAERGVAIAGAGPIGKSLARALIRRGVTVHGFFEVHPRRIGERIHGAPVASVDELAGRWRGAVLLAAVGLEGGRERLGRLLAATDREEGRELWRVC